MSAEVRVYPGEVRRVTYIDTDENGVETRTVEDVPEGESVSVNVYPGRALLVEALPAPEPVEQPTEG